jgi:hypothetical protein
MKARPVARAALPVALMCLLAACETLDRLAFGPEPTVAANPVVATPLPAGTGYPTVNTVPPRPQLSYSIEQERAIVEALISDREHAWDTRLGTICRSRSSATARTSPNGCWSRGGVPSAP